MITVQQIEAAKEFILNDYALIGLGGEKRWNFD
jgi:hypothetical protein